MNIEKHRRKVEYPEVAKLHTDFDGNEYKNSYWHYVTQICGDPAILCTGEFLAESAGGSDDTETKIGKITCPECKNMIREFKAVKL